MACSANKKLVVFIVDDEPGPLQTLANDLKEMPEVGEVCTFSSYSDAVYPLITKQPDVVFLDVEVPGKSGLDFLRDIRPRISFTFHAVFYTAYSHYMIDAIRNSAFDFLLKPYKSEELRTVIDRVILAPADSVPPSSHYAPKHQPGTHKLALQTISELLLVSVSEVLMLQYERQSRAWLLYLTDNSTHRLHSGIKRNCSTCRARSCKPVLAASSISPIWPPLKTPPSAVVSANPSREWNFTLRGAISANSRSALR